MDYRCFRSEFSADEYRRYRDQFAVIPRSWIDEGPDGRSTLARMWNEGGTGLISLAPLLLRMAAGQEHTGRAFLHSREELSRLTGCDGKSIDKARAVLRDWGWASTESTASRFGQRLLSWDVSPSVLPSRDENGRFEEYFYFPLRLVYGGQWAVMSATERLLYLALGMKSFATAITPDNALLLPIFGMRYDTTDLHQSAPGGREEARLSWASQRDLASVAGCHSRTAERVINDAWKSPRHWSERKDTDPRWWDYAAVWAYPGKEGGTLLYHLRDHVRPLPPAFMNHSARKQMVATKSFGALLPQDTRVEAPAPATIPAHARRAYAPNPADDGLVVSVF